MSNTDLRVTQVPMLACERDFRIVPLHPGTKKPVEDDWPNRALSCPIAIAQALETGRNYGIATGNGLVGTDIDPKNGGSIETLEQINGGPLPRTFTVRTPSGGLHHYWRHPTPFANSKDRVGKGIDVRGERGQLVGPWSTVDGKDYEIVDNSEIAELPPRLAEKLTLASTRTKQADEWWCEPDDPRDVAAAEKYLESLNGDVSGRYVKVCKLMDRGVSDEWIWDKTFDLGWDHDDKLELKIENAATYRQSARGCYSFEAEMWWCEQIVPPRRPLHLASSAAAPYPVDALGPVLTPAANAKSPLIKFYEDMQAEPRIDWLIKGLAPRASIGFIGGASGAGKTFLAVDAAMAVMTGRDFLTRKTVERGAVIYIAGEGGYSFQTRVHGAAAHKYGMAPADARKLPLGLIDSPPDMLAPTSRQELLKKLAAANADTQRRYGVPIRLVVLDTYARSFRLGEENSPTENAKATDAMRDISNALGAVVVAVHHVGKDPTRGLRGSSSLRADADFVVLMEKGKAWIDKCRDGPEGEQWHLDMPTVSVGTQDDGTPLTSRFVNLCEWPVPPTPGDGPSAEDSSRGARILDEAFLQAVKEGSDTVEMADLWPAFYSRWGSKNKDTNRRALDRAIEKGVERQRYTEKDTRLVALWRGRTSGHGRTNPDTCPDQ